MRYCGDIRGNQQHSRKPQPFKMKKKMGPNEVYQVVLYDMIAVHHNVFVEMVDRREVAAGL